MTTRKLWAFVAFEAQAVCTLLLGSCAKRSRREHVLKVAATPRNLFESLRTRRIGNGFHYGLACSLRVAQSIALPASIHTRALDLAGREVQVRQQASNSKTETYWGLVGNKGRYSPYNPYIAYSHIPYQPLPTPSKETGDLQSQNREPGTAG